MEESLNTPVIYPAGIVKNQEADETQAAAAKSFLEYLTSDEVISVFEKYGFTAYTK
jgi:molybdate transport system substrate-binding protein